MSEIACFFEEQISLRMIVCHLFGIKDNVEKKNDKI